MLAVLCVGQYILILMADPHELEFQLRDVESRLAVAREIIRDAALRASRAIGEVAIVGSRADVEALHDRVVASLEAVDEAGMIFHHFVDTGELPDESVDQGVDGDGVDSDEEVDADQNESIDEAPDEEPEIEAPDQDDVITESDDGVTLEVLTTSEDLEHRVTALVRDELERRGRTETQEISINIGQIARGLNGGRDLPGDEYHELIQWLNPHPMVVRRVGSNYIIQLPVTQETRRGVTIPDNLVELVFGYFVMTYGQTDNIHINQICDALGLHDVSKAQKREMISILASDPRIIKKSGSSISFAQDADSEEDHDTSSTESWLGNDDVLAAIRQTQCKQLASRCLGEGARMLDIKSEVPFVVDMLVDDDDGRKYDEFKHTTFPVMRDLIIDDLRVAGISAQWEIVGATRAMRYKLVVLGIGDKHPSSPKPPVSRERRLNSPVPKRLERPAPTPKAVPAEEPGGVNEAHVREASQNIRHVVPSTSRIKKKDLLELLAVGRITRQEAEQAISQAYNDGTIKKTTDKGSVFFTRTAS